MRHPLAPVVRRSAAGGGGRESERAFRGGAERRGRGAQAVRGWGLGEGPSRGPLPRVAQASSSCERRWRPSASPNTCADGHGRIVGRRFPSGGALSAPPSSQGKPGTKRRRKADAERKAGREGRSDGASARLLRLGSRGGVVPPQRPLLEAAAELRQGEADGGDEGAERIGAALGGGGIGNCELVRGAARAVRGRRLGGWRVGRGWEERRGRWAGGRGAGGEQGGKEKERGPASLGVGVDGGGVVVDEEEEETRDADDLREGREGGGGRRALGAGSWGRAEEERWGVRGGARPREEGVVKAGDALRRERRGAIRPGLREGGVCR